MQILLPQEAYARLSRQAKARNMSTKEYSALVLVDHVLKIN